MNVAVACARLGAPSAFVGAVSTDEFGQQIMAHLETNGVNTAAVQRSDAPTAQAIVEHTPKLRFRFEGDGTADTRLRSVDWSNLGHGPHILHGGTLGLFRGVTADTLAEAAEQHRGIVSLDPNIRPQIIDNPEGWHHYHRRWLAAAHIYKGSDEDLEWIFPGESLDAIVDILLAEGVRAVILTRGAEGLSITTGKGRVEAAAPPVEVVDTVGAGDTIVGAVLTSLHEMELGADASPLDTVELADWQQIANRAVTAAAFTCTRSGADVPHRHELDW